MDPDNTATDAYRLAYNASNMSPEAVHVEASRLLHHPKVALRIASLRQAVTDILIAKRAWDTDRFIDEAEVHRQGAMADHQWSAANAALTTIGKAAGLLEGQPQAPVPISKITVVLNEHKREALEDTPALEAGYRALPDEAK